MSGVVQLPYLGTPGLNHSAFWRVGAVAIAWDCASLCRDEMPGRGEKAGIRAAGGWHVTSPLRVHRTGDPSLPGGLRLRVRPNVQLLRCGADLWARYAVPRPIPRLLQGHSPAAELSPARLLQQRHDRGRTGRQRGRGRTLLRDRAGKEGVPNHARRFVRAQRNPLRRGRRVQQRLRKALRLPGRVHGLRETRGGFSLQPGLPGV
jgi:hypothetical protein